MMTRPACYSFSTCSANLCPSRRCQSPAATATVCADAGDQACECMMPLAWGRCFSARLSSNWTKSSGVYRSVNNKLANASGNHAEVLSTPATPSHRNDSVARCVVTEFIGVLHRRQAKSATIFKEGITISVIRAFLFSTPRGPNGSCYTRPFC
jgi:hypothetical protein